MHHSGKGVPQNDETAVKWYRLAAEQGNAKSQNKLKTLKIELVRKSINDCRDYSDTTHP
jgi:TPR repeat protein